MIDNPYSQNGFSRPAHRGFNEGYRAALKDLLASPDKINKQQVEAMLEEAEQLKVASRL